MFAFNHPFPWNIDITEIYGGVETVSGERIDESVGGERQST